MNASQWKPDPVCLGECFIKCNGGSCQWFCQCYCLISITAHIITAFRQKNKLKYFRRFIYCYSGIGLTQPHDKLTHALSSTARRTISSTCFRFASLSLVARICPTAISLFMVFGVVCVLRYRDDLVCLEKTFVIVNVGWYEARAVIWVNNEINLTSMSYVRLTFSYLTPLVQFRQCFCRKT